MKVIICTEVRTQHKLRDKTNKEIKTNGRTKGDSIKDAERYTGKQKVRGNRRGKAHERRKNVVRTRKRRREEEKKDQRQTNLEDEQRNKCEHKLPGTGRESTVEKIREQGRGRGHKKLKIKEKLRRLQKHIQIMERKLSQKRNTIILLKTPEELYFEFDFLRFLCQANAHFNIISE